VAGPDLVRLAARLAGVLGPEQCVLVGGLALAGHGYLRATDDIDFVAREPLSRARAKLAAHGIETKLLKGDPLEGDFACLRGEIEGVRFDVLPALVPIEWGKSIETTAEGARLRVVDVEGLMRLKLRARGPQDIHDVAVLVLKRPELRERAREMAAGERILDRLDEYLADRRTRAKAEAQPGPRPPRRPGRKRSKR
jgi:hypothetical protein